MIANLILVKRGSHKKSPSKETHKRSPCAIACTLDLLGDKWTLLVIRDLLWFDKQLYNQLQQSGEKIPTNMLADRLKRLEEVGIITKEAYQQHPVRYAYRLTPMGTALHPLLKEMVQWGMRHLPDSSFPEELRRRLRI